MTKKKPKQRSILIESLYLLREQETTGSTNQAKVQDILSKTYDYLYNRPLYIPRELLRDLILETIFSWELGTIGELTESALNELGLPCDVAKGDIEIINLLSGLKPNSFTYALICKYKPHLISRFEILKSFC